MPPNDEQQETSMREDMEAAIENIESPPTDDQQAAAGEGLNDDDGQETPEAKAKEQVEAEAGAAIEEAAKPKDDGSADDSVAASQAADESGTDDGEPKAQRKPPESWTPAAREEWAKLPAAVRAQVTKREREIELSLNEGAQHRKTGAAFQGIADRYAQIIAAEGAPDALTGVEELVKTVATLRMGSAQQKAAKVAGFIQHYGIDVVMLDDMLSGKAVDGAGTPEGVDPNLAAYLDSRLKPVDSLLSRMDETSRRSQYEANQKAIEEVTQFKQSHEFYAEVQNDMADMVEMAESRGYKMPLQEAYDKACALNPEISSILAKRASDEALKTGQQQLEQKQHAASSITGHQSGAAMQGELSMRDTMEQAWDAQTG